MVTNLFTGLKISFKIAAFGPLQEYWYISISKVNDFFSFKKLNSETFYIFLKAKKSSFMLVLKYFKSIHF